MGLIEALKGRITGFSHAKASTGSMRLKPVDDERVIVSLTSYPARIDTVHETIRSLLGQTFRFDELILWLAEDEFPAREADLPSQLLELRGEGLIIRWCQNLGSHKKYYYAMRENPDAVIITFDDDMHYDENAVSILYAGHLRHKDAICARRARLMRHAEDGLIPYIEWELYRVADEPLDDLVATGVGGVLYPPHLMDDRLFDEATLMETAPKADDLWLKTMQLLKGTPTVLVDTAFEQNPVDGTQEVSLYLSNQLQGKNDEAIQRIRQTFDHKGVSVWR